jgi:hypothetical protein
LRAAQKAQREQQQQQQQQNTDLKTAEAQSADLESTVTPSGLHQQARRFHLARSLSSFPDAGPTASYRKPTSKIQPPLATFVERRAVLLAGHDYLTRPAVDRILTKSSSADNTDLSKATDFSSEDTKTFVKPIAPTKKAGTSISDHPSTWDITSDQLANELAALAMEIEPPELPVGHSKETFTAPGPVLPTHRDVEMTDDDFVYEIYVRVAREDAPLASLQPGPLDSNYGLLVIEEQDEELWQFYMEGDDEESDWDEEDSNGELDL